MFLQSFVLNVWSAWRPVGRQASPARWQLLCLQHVNLSFLCQREPREQPVCHCLQSTCPALIWPQRLHSYSNPQARAADVTGHCPSNVSDVLNAAYFTGLSHISAHDISIYSPSLMQGPSGQTSVYRLQCCQFSYTKNYIWMHAVIPAANRFSNESYLVSFNILRMFMECFSFCVTILNVTICFRNVQRK